MFYFRCRYCCCRRQGLNVVLPSYSLWHWCQVSSYQRSLCASQHSPVYCQPLSTWSCHGSLLVLLPPLHSFSWFLHNLLRGDLGHCCHSFACFPPRPGAVKPQKMYKFWPFQKQYESLTALKLA